MINQAPATGGASAPAASNTSTSSDNKTSTTLLKDCTFLRIHDAFLLGWCLMELKSRIQTVACILSLNAEVVCNALKNPASTQPQAQDEQSNLDRSTQDNPQHQPQAQDEPPDSIDALLENVILKDVVAWKDVRGMPDVSNKPIFQRKSLSTELQDNIWLTSVLRALFSQIATLHLRRFPDSDTTDTIYDLPPPPQHADDLKNCPYPYLYPPGEPDNYANVGIRKIKKDDTGYNNIDIDTFVQQFRLYEVTLRALNCLTLLLTTAENSLIPETIEDYQQEIVRQLFTPPSTFTGSDSSGQTPIPLEAATSADTGQSSTGMADQDNDRKAAIRKLTNLVIPLLEAWDGFLRESFYVDTNSLDDDPGNEIELVAYEAGRSLAALSWGISVALTPLENIENIDTILRDERPNADGSYPLRNILAKKVQNTWLNVFNDRDVNHVQHQIAALSTALDEAYYRVHTDLKPQPPKPDDSPAPSDPNLPGEAIQAIKHSLDYWERTIARMCSQDNPLIRPMPAKTQTQNGSPAKTQTQSSDIAASLTPLDWNLSKTLRAELIQQSTVWQSLILCQQGLQSFTVETVTQKILNDFMQDLEKAAGQEIFNNGAVVSTLRIIGIIFGVLVLIVLISIGVFLIARPQGFNPMSIITSSPVVITAVVTAIGAIATPFVNGFLSRLSKIGSFFGSAGTVMEKSLQDGYQQILVEFGYLNHSIGVTFPLIEFFVWEGVKYKAGKSPEVAIEDGYDFLVNVFWTDEDREEELQRVARAAFGPIGTFVGASLKLGDNGSQQTSPPTSHAAHLS